MICTPCLVLGQRKKSEAGYLMLEEAVAVVKGTLWALMAITAGMLAIAVLLAAMPFALVYSWLFEKGS